MQQDPLEIRVTNNEIQIAELKNRLENHIETQGNIDLALLARVDGFIADLRRMEIVQMKGFEELKAGQKDLEAGQKGLETGMVAIVDILKNHKTAIDMLVVGQGQIVETLKDHKVAIQTLTVGQGQIVETLKDHKVAIQTLTVGQEQIIRLLTRGGKPPLHD